MILDVWVTIIHLSFFNILLKIYTLSAINSLLSAMASSLKDSSVGYKYSSSSFKKVAKRSYNLWALYKEFLIMTKHLSDAKKDEEINNASFVSSLELMMFGYLNFLITSSSFNKYPLFLYC